MNARSWFFSGVAVCLNIPTFVYAQAGLVPCGRAGQGDCQTCHVVQLVSGVNAWLVGILSIVATIMFVIAGFRLVTSNGNPSVLQDAKSMIINVAIGFVIVLSAWLLLDLFMKSLLSDSEQGLGPWNEIECVDQPVARTDPGRLEITITTEIETTESCTTAASCAALQSQCEARPGGTVNLTGNPGNFQVGCTFSSSDSASNPPDLSAAGACDSDLVGQYFPEQVGNAQCVIGGESTCGAGMVSVTDTLRNDGGRAFSFGPTQVNITVHPVIGCGPRLDCPSAFRGRDYSAVVVNEALYQECARALQDVDCGLTNSRRIYDDAAANPRTGYNGWQPWSAATGCGLRP